MVGAMNGLNNYQLYHVQVLNESTNIHNIYDICRRKFCIKYGILTAGYQWADSKYLPNVGSVRGGACTIVRRPFFVARLKKLSLTLSGLVA